MSDIGRLEEIMGQLMEAWAFKVASANSVYVTRGNVEFIKTELKKQGYGHVKVYQL